MTTITVEVPDELATRLNALRERLPELLSRLLASPEEKASQALKKAAIHPAYQEMMEFLGSSPTTKQIIDFRISATAQDRLEELLEKNRDEGLTEAESAELDVYELVHHSVVQLKAHARLSKF